MKAFKNLNKEIKMLDLIKVEKNFFRQKTFFQIKKSFYSKKKIRQTFSDLKNGHEKKYK